MRYPHIPYPHPMIRWRIPEILKQRGWSAYRLAQECGLTMPAASRLARGGPVARIDARTLDALCSGLGLEPGDLLERERNRPRRPR
jgi:DNA-binding Xre family transcriptional regulator